MPRRSEISGPDAPRSRGGTEALERALAEYWRPLVAYARRLLGDASAAEDVVQRAFVRLWERDHALPEGEALRPFLYRVVRNLVLNEWRRDGIRERWLAESSTEAEEVVLGPDRHLELLELQEAIDAAVESLPARRREIFVLSRFHGLTNAQIAEVLELSSQTIANQLVSALRTLRVLLRPHLGAADAPMLQIVRGGQRTAG
jgi:RNA polymerase sigma-70 factor (ECF subfamily)